jgi:ATP-dependent DNA helicase RecG
VIVRFRPARHAPPTSAGHELSPLQRELLGVVANIGSGSHSDVRAALQSRAADRTIRENLAPLRELGLVDSVGRGRGARWMLKGATS